MPAIDKKPGITIAIVTYERLDFLPSALQSACEQEVAAEEVLVIDDGSTPAVRALVEDFQNRYPDSIRYVWQENAGRPAARNRAVEECCTSHLLWLDDDYYLTSHAIASHKTILETEPDADIIYGRLTRCNEELDPIGPLPSYEFDRSNKLYLFFERNPIPNSGTLISLSCFERIGSYDSAFALGEDYDLYSRAASLGAKFVHNPTEICLCRSHDGYLALKSEQKNAAKYHALVVQNFVARHDLEDLFPHLEWDRYPEKSLEAACWEMAFLFARFGAFDCCRDALDCSLEVTPCKTASVALELIQDVFEGSLDRIASRKGNVRLYGPRISTLIDCALEYLCTPLEAEAFKLDLLNTRSKRFSIQTGADNSKLSNPPQRPELPVKENNLGPIEKVVEKSGASDATGPSFSDSLEKSIKLNFGEKIKLST